VEERSLVVWLAEEEVLGSVPLPDSAVPHFIRMGLETAGIDTDL
jgi:hypothetical protein